MGNSLALIDINTLEKDNNGSKRLSSTLSVSNRKHLLWVFFVYRATLSEKKFHLRPTPCPLSKSQCLEKECILDMVPENAHYQQHGCGYFPFKSLLRCSDDSSLPLVEKIRNSMGFWATNRLRVDKVWTAGCFSVQPLLRIISNNRLHRIKISSCFPCWMGCKTLFCSYSCAHFP